MKSYLLVLSLATLASAKLAPLRATALDARVAPKSAVDIRGKTTPRRQSEC